VTRRQFFSTAAGAIIPSTAEEPLVVRVNQVLDTRAKYTPQELAQFSSRIWPEAVRDFKRCGIQLQRRQREAETRRSPGGRPVFTGLEHGIINLALTDYIPLNWDNGRGLHGVTTQHDGYHLCVIALKYAHCHQIPFLSINTCVHELLHVLLHDIFESRPKGLPGHGREFRIDFYATRLWLFHDGSGIRNAAHAYLARLASNLVAHT
jgi:hypothetical protein